MERPSLPHHDKEADTVLGASGAVQGRRASGAVPDTGARRIGPAAGRAGRWALLLLAALASTGVGCSLSGSLDRLTAAKDGGVEDGGVEAAACPDAAGSAGACGAEASSDAGLDAASCPDATAYATDPANCGRCGHDCAGGTCSNGVCQPFALVSAAGTSGYLRLDDKYVYFTDTNAGDILRVPKTGGAVQILATAQPNPFQLAVDDSSVYFTAAGSLRRVPKSGGNVQTLVPGNDIDEVVAGTASLYYADYASSGGGAVYSASKDGTGIRILASSVTNCESVAPWGSDLFFGGSFVGAVPIAGGTVTTLDTTYARRIAVDSQNVYAIDHDGPTVQRIPRDGGTAQVLAISPAAVGASDIALDSKDVYWTVDQKSGYVLRVSKAGGTMDVIASEDQPWGIAVDDTAIYWSLPGIIMKLAK